MAGFPDFFQFFRGKPAAQFTETGLCPDSGKALPNTGESRPPELFAEPVELSETRDHVALDAANATVLPGSPPAIGQIVPAGSACSATSRRGRGFPASPAGKRAKWAPKGRISGSISSSFRAHRASVLVRLSEVHVIAVLIAQAEPLIRRQDLV